MLFSVEPRKEHNLNHQRKKKRGRVVQKASNLTKQHGFLSRKSVVQHPDPKLNSYHSISPGAGSHWSWLFFPRLGLFPAGKSYPFSRSRETLDSIHAQCVSGGHSQEVLHLSGCLGGESSNKALGTCIRFETFT